MHLAATGLIAILAVGPATAATQGTPPAVQLEIELPRQGSSLMDPSGLTLRVEPAESVVLRLRLLEESDPSSRVTVDDATDLLEIRGPDGAVRLSDWNMTGPGVYETIYVFGGSGSFELVVLPDVDRNSLPAASSDRVTVTVEAATVSTPVAGFTTTSIVVFTLLVFGVAALVVVGTRGRRRVPKGPALHDTWWNSP